jgi:CheY-like chemotaxis protein
MKFNILIVDDEKNIREGLGRALELEGYRTLLAPDGEQAMEMVEKEEVDLIIADLKMPGLSGQELLKKVVSAYPTVPR